MKMKELVDRYLSTRHDGMEQSTYKNVESVLNRLAKSWDATRRQPSSMDEEWLRLWLQRARLGEGGHGHRLANVSYNNLVAKVAKFVEYLVRRSIVSPFTLDACVKVSTGPRKEYLQLTAVQVTHMIETCEDPWERWVLAFASQTLARDSELRNRQVRHFHPERLSLDWYRKKTTDTDRMPMTQQLAEEWERWLYAYQAKCGSVAKGWYAVPARHYSFHGDRWLYQPGWRPKQLGPVVQKHAARVAGEAVADLKGQGVHILRRSMARALYDRCVTVEDIPEGTALNRVQTMLGHAASSTTMRYIGVEPDREARNKLLAGSDLLWAPTDNVVQLRSVGDA